MERDYIDEAFVALGAWGDWAWDPATRTATRGNASLRLVSHGGCTVGILFTGVQARAVVSQATNEIDAMMQVCRSAALRPSDAIALGVTHLLDVGHDAHRRHIDHLLRAP